ncbi:hypothetical protein DFH28DRAFT_1158900 [Melampsora americana]|nr:hypothetical protein DFH28DRAFT_1158900 [Melampsora americana]
MGMKPELIAILDNLHVMGEEVKVIEGTVTRRQILIPSWWSKKFLEFMVQLERRVQVSILAQKLKGPTRTLRQFVASPNSIRQFVASPNSTIETLNVPQGLPQDCYSKTKFLDLLLPVQLKAWNLQPAIFPKDVKSPFSPPGNPSVDSDSTPNNTLTSCAKTSDARPTASVTTPAFGDQDPSEFPAGMFDDEVMNEEGEEEIL